MKVEKKTLLLNMYTLLHRKYLYETNNQHKTNNNIQYISVCNYKIAQ